MKLEETFNLSRGYLTNFIYKENSHVDEKYKKVYCIMNEHLSQLYSKSDSSLFSLAILMGDVNDCDKNKSSSGTSVEFCSIDNCPKEIIPRIHIYSGKKP